MDGIIQSLPAPLRRISTYMDFVGQQKAERVFQVILVVSGIIGFCVGYFTQQMSHAVYTLLGGFALSCLIILPPWPLFRRNPIHWQPVQPVTVPKEKKKTK
ncbi:hypothetical protein AB6A40_009496 [Gnathostoma spinigerum]|uniref:Signal peptidase complex subunit 1 n=1 Tax=Gnathostoma spinigerum TaxID=75299 RepID=A0ABD6F0R9_9BILA